MSHTAMSLIRSDLSRESSKIEELKNFLEQKDAFGEPIYYFGQSTWQAGAKNILNSPVYENENEQLADILHALLLGLLGYQKYMKGQAVHMNAGDRRGDYKLRVQMSEIMIKISELMQK